MTIDNILYPSFYDLSDQDKYQHTLEAVEALKNQLTASLESLEGISVPMDQNTLQSFAEKELCNIHSSWYNNIKIGIKNDYPKCVDKARIIYQ